MSIKMDAGDFAPERTMQLCNKALDVIAMLVNKGETGHEDELYSWLSEEVGMTDEEIRQAGFDCLPDEDYRYEVFGKDGNLIEDGYCDLDTAVEYAIENEGYTVKRAWYNLDEFGRLDYDKEPSSADIMWERSVCEECCYFGSCADPLIKTINGIELCDDFKRETGGADDETI